MEVARKTWHGYRGRLPATICTVGHRLQWAVHRYQWWIFYWMLLKRTNMETGRVSKVERMHAWECLHECVISANWNLCQLENFLEFVLKWHVLMFSGEAYTGPANIIIGNLIMVNNCMCFFCQSLFFKGNTSKSVVIVLVIAINHIWVFLKIKSHVRRTVIPVMCNKRELVFSQMCLSHCIKTDHICG